MLEVKRPTLLIDKRRCLSNIQRMVNKSKRSNTLLRPHFKTHQSPQVAEWFRAYGISKITVSSVEMAALFASHGWNDITIAFPVNMLELPAIKDLANSIHLNLLLESPEIIKTLNLRRPIFKKTAAYGHFGRNDPDFTWEKLDKVDGIRRALRL